MHANDYDAAMSQAVDVTVFDAQPHRDLDRVQEPVLPRDFDRPVLMIAENSPRVGKPLGLKLDWL